MIAAGDRIPQCLLQYMTDLGPSDISTDEIFSGKNVILFGVPGAFTPSCHHIHLPSYLHEYHTLRKAGIDMIACISVNDVFVMDMWAQMSDPEGKLMFLADGNAEFAYAAGLTLDASDLQWGLRSRRYALWAQDGLVRAINVEEDPSMAEASTAYGMLRMFSAWTETH